jgi:hypothetical protein
MSYFKLINSIKDFIEDNNLVNTVLDADVEEKTIDVYERNIYSLAYISVDDLTVGEKLNTYTVTIYFLDYVVENNNLTIEKFKGNSNIQEVYQAMDNALTRLFLKIQFIAKDLNINIINVNTAQKIDQYDTDNRIAGWEGSFQIEVPHDKITVCETT